MDAIPGASVLGYGFNVLGDYDISSVTQQIYAHEKMDGGTWTYPPTGITYQVPDNTTVADYTTTTGGTQLFTTQQQFQTYFAAKASVGGSYGGFSGEFDFAYSQILNTDRSYSYGLSEADYTGWKLILSDQASSWLSYDFTHDPDVEKLPTTFTPLNQDLFFAVFRRFGTHFISQVTVGGRLYYFEAVERSYSSNEQQVQANLALEYKALFISAKAEAGVEWKQLGQTWADSRIVKVNAVGGDTSILNALDPGYGDSDSDLFNKWQTGVMTNPSVVDFELSPLNLLFDGDRAAAVQEALEAYTNGALIGYGNSDYAPGRGPAGGNFVTSSGIMVAGTIIQPDPPVIQPQPTIWQGQGYRIVVPIGGYQIALLDPTTHEPIMSHLYYQDPRDGLKTESLIYPEMLNDLGKVSQKRYIAVAVAFAIDLMNYPSADFAQWLASVGGALDGWKQFIGFTGTPGQCSYICIGALGLMPGNAIESFAAATDWADYPWASTTDVSATALLYAQSDLSFAGPRSFRSLAVPAPA